MQPDTPIIFLNAAVILDDAASIAAGTGGARSLSIPSGESSSARGVNKLCEQTGALLVINGSFGLRDARGALRGRGVTARFHADYQIDQRQFGGVGQVGLPAVGGEGVSPSELPPLNMSLRQPINESPAARWWRTHGRPVAIMIDRPGARTFGVPLVTVELGAALGGLTVERLLPLLQAAPRQAAVAGCSA